MSKHNILVISPAGRVYNHDCVEWYPEPFSEIKSKYFNIGDMVVHDSTLKIIDFNSVEGVVIERLDEGLIEWYKTFDYILIRASNFIHNEMNWIHGLEVIKRVNLPVYVIGVGAQSASAQHYQLNNHNLNFWKEVSSRCNMIGVRGEFTANLLEFNGIKNVEIVGCPTIFRTRKNDLEIKNPFDVKKIAFSVRREVDHTYTENVNRYHDIQRRLLISAAKMYDTTITTHGEPEEKAFFYHDRIQQQVAKNRFINEKWWTPDTEESMEMLYRRNLFFFLKVEDYDEFIRTQDIAIGYRVHGVLPALANGVPGFLFTYDSRSGELAKTHKIPSMPSEDALEKSLDEILMTVDYSEFNNFYPIAYNRMKSFLLSNGLSTRM